MPNVPEVVVFWFRRDLRLHDNHGLFRALISGLPVLPVFIFDPIILGKLENKSDKRVAFIHGELTKLKTLLQNSGSDLEVLYQTPLQAFQSLFDQFRIKAVYANQDFEPYALQRDESVKEWCKSKGVSFHTFNDQVVFDGTDILKDDGTPYTVFTPYSRKWMQRLEETGLENYPSETLMYLFLAYQGSSLPTLTDIGFQPSDVFFDDAILPVEIIQSYHQTRDIPSLNGTSRLGVALRFGTMSIRKLVRTALEYNATFLKELIWREFYQMILQCYPQVGAGRSFHYKYDQLPWLNDETHFDLWCKGQTGYPLVDAGMRQLMQTGYMHNRVRMVTASFLCKHLLIDWRWGESWFAQHLMDFDFSANNGGWQWAAGCGTDAAPYFRIFNPVEQQKKFDPEFSYIRKWVPEWNTPAYALPIVDHKEARLRCLRFYKQALQ